MKDFLLSLALLLALCQLTQTNCLFAGKINFGWNLYNTTGQIYDMEFMPDQNSFIMATENDIQIRNTMTGELEKIYPNIKQYQTKIKYSKDGSHFIMSTSRYFQSRNISDMSLIKQDSLTLDTDKFIKIIEEIAVDPIRPYLYGSIAKSGFIGPNLVTPRELVRYNVETFQPIDTLAHLGGLIDVSHDGRYLAMLAGGASHIRVFDLSTLKQVRDFKLCDEYAISGTAGVATCLKFSEINTDNIYFSGSFPESKNVGRFRGLLIYNIQQNRIIDSIFAVPPKFLLEGYFDFFQNKNTIIDASQGKNFIIDNINKKIVFSIDARAGDPGAWSKFVNRNNIFIGFADIYFSMGQYDSTVGINEDPQIQKIIYPNPTSDFLEISIAPLLTLGKVEIFSIEGIKILESEPVQRIDVSRLVPGVYFVKLGSRVQKFVKM